ncbi:two-component system histidine kinase PnpS [Macrococcus bovicus]|uniref:Sensor protein kinase WalK n=1 Tax=Macrococcus bovicus TaxID=69968 RepID=A0A4R6C3A7_9STAP|nr:ATP-binding protein [Macrococcus bovicus]TDM15778.1 PAS domain-containing protein [Macrococcus bovicus]
MRSFTNRLFTSLVALMILSFLLIGFFLSNILSEQISKTKEAELERQAEQLIEVLKNEDRYLQKIKDYDRVSLKKVWIEKDGKTLFKSDTIDDKQIEEVMAPWISHNNAGFYRFKRENNEALLIYREDGYTIFLIDRLTNLEGLNKTIWQYMFLTLATAIPVIFFLVRYINRTYIAPIREVTYASRLLTEGNYKVRVPESTVTETKELYISTNRLARTLQTLNNEQKLQRNRLETTLENIPSAILMIDKKGQVVIVNDNYNETFNKGQQILSGHFEDVIRFPSVKQMIKEAMRAEKPINKTIDIQMAVYRKYFDAAVVPVLSRRRRKLEGVVVVLHDITKLKSLEQMRKDFVANVSHELKTPITSIKGFSETLLDGAKNNPETLDMFLDIILKESNRIQGLVSELLELSKIEQSSHIILESVNMSRKALSCIEVVEPLAAKKKIVIETRIDEDVIVLAEASKLKQVIINLLSNAINYSPEGSRVKVSVIDGKQGILEVSDEGMGIAKEEQTRIFERFYRVDKARSRDSGGTGLGLAIVKHIVEAFDGVIEVDSELSKGSTFRVYLKKS